jgi:hypothetical protein
MIEAAMRAGSRKFGVFAMGKSCYTGSWMTT